MKEIILTKGQVALVDDEDFDRVNAFKWHANLAKKPNKYYARAYMREPGPRKYKIILMSRFIMDTPKDLVCDHINHNTLDNRKSNLRNCTVEQNNMNKRVRKDNILGIKNIWKTGNRYAVHIVANKKEVIFESFKSLKDAISARDNLSKLLHKDFYLKSKEPPA